MCRYVFRATIQSANFAHYSELRIIDLSHMKLHESLGHMIVCGSRGLVETDEAGWDLELLVTGY